MPKQHDTVASGSHAANGIAGRPSGRHKGPPYRDVDQLLAAIEHDGWSSLTKAERHRFWMEMSNGGLYLFHPTEQESNWLRDPSISEEAKARIWDGIRERKRVEDWNRLQAAERRLRRGPGDEMRQAWLALREQNFSRLEADRRVAKQFGLNHAESVRRARRKPPRWE